jgi:hypothetical protein
MQICAKHISKEMMQKLEKETAMLVCKIEKVFPPGWFNVIQHLLLYLSWEARVGGQKRVKKNLDLWFAKGKG